MRVSRGFTLIEILVVLAIFTVIALVANQILFSTLRGSAKSEVTARVKREGERVMSVMERLLHNSRSIVSCDSVQVTYRDLVGVQSSFSCQSGAVYRDASILTSSDVDVVACSITCETVGGVTKAVNITLGLSQRAGGTLRVQERARIDLQTKVLLRN